MAALNPTEVHQVLEADSDDHEFTDGESAYGSDA